MTEFTLIEEYYKENGEELSHKIRRRVGSLENAEDVVQEAFTRAMEYWGSYDKTRSFERWFNGILNNSIKDFNRKERNQGMCKEEEGVINIEEEVAERDAVKKLRKDISKVIDSYPRPERDVLFLYYIRGYNHRAISHVLDVPRKSIRQIIWRFNSYVKKTTSGLC